MAETIRACVEDVDTEGTRHRISLVEDDGDFVVSHIYRTVRDSEAQGKALHCINLMQASDIYCATVYAAFPNRRVVA